MTTTTSTTSAPSVSAATTLANTGSTILSTLSSGSGIDDNALITKLVDASTIAESTSLTTKQTQYETQISDFGLLRSSFTALETAASTLGNPDTFNAKSVNVPTTTQFGISKLDAKAAVGTYSIRVDKVAQSQSVSSTGFVSQTATIGKGTLAIRFGTWTNVDDSAVPPVVSTFAVDSTKTGGTITINDSNNSLIGLRDSINKAGLGLTASIVTDAGKYKLLVTSPSGASSEVEITATEDPTALGLSNFNFNQSAHATMTQQQGGADSKVYVNGMAFTRSTNHLSDVIDGLELDLNNSSPSEVINVGITADKTVAEKNIRDFVTAYNKFLTDSGKLVGFDSDKNQYGSLHTDPLAKNLVQQVRSQINSAVTGVSGSFTSFTSLGIHTELDGSLTIDDSSSTTSFRNSMDNNYDSVRDLFIPKTSSTNAQITVTKNSASSTPGSYDVAITQSPTKGTLVGGAVNTLVAGGAYSFIATIDGTSSSTITLPTTPYASGADLAADVQSRINSDPALLAKKISVNVLYNAGQLEFTSSSFGSNSSVAFSGVSAQMTTDLGISNSVGTAGLNVAGTVGGVAGFGLGDVLLPALGSKAEGLSMHVEPGATTGTITFSRGFAGNFTHLIDDFLKTSGLIKGRETNINTSITKVKDDQKALSTRSAAYKARLQAQFSAMEAIVRSLKTTGTFLTNAFKSNTSSSGN